MNGSIPVSVNDNQLNYNLKVSTGSDPNAIANASEEVIVVPGRIQLSEQDFQVLANSEIQNEFRMSVDMAIERKYDAPTYQGDYIVTPLAHDAVILSTKEKVMKDNVTVKKIPYFETTNDYGTTIYIGSEI